MEEVSVSTVAVAATANKGHHLLKLQGYKQLQGMHAHGKYFESCPFQAVGHTWKIRCYPNGYLDEHAGFFSLYLVLDNNGSEDDAICAKVELALVHHNPMLPGTKPYSYTYTHNFGKEEPSWGFGKFILVKELESRGFLKDDRLDVRCTVTAVEMSAVKDAVVKKADMKRMEVKLCSCNDDLCKRHHHKGRLKKAFLRLWRSI
ncbi:unnamed protein product [Urochloa decumbens]|uniref:MATH domain-containing protein n=1 Tax=Urochloa decumbens TaxID=240449 RepID=A0ABC9FLX6_9POAL